MNRQVDCTCACCQPVRECSSAAWLPPGGIASVPSSTKPVKASKVCAFVCFFHLAKSNFHLKKTVDTQRVSLYITTQRVDIARSSCTRTRQWRSNQHCVQQAYRSAQLRMRARIIAATRLFLRALQRCKAYEEKTE